MSFHRKSRVRGVTAIALLALIPLSSKLVAQEHLVSQTALQDAAVDASLTRQQNLDTLELFFSTDKATKAMQTSHMNPQEVKSAIATLNDQELAQLTARANRAQNDFAAGRLSDRDLLIILLAIAALILISVAVR